MSTSIDLYYNFLRLLTNEQLNLRLNYYLKKFIRESNSLTLEKALFYNERIKFVIEEQERRK
jgi:hypothetical protein